MARATMFEPAETQEVAENTAQDSQIEDQGAEISADNAQEPSPRLIYIGPNLARVPLTQYQVFKDGIPARAVELSKTVPEILNLFIPVAQLAVARTRIQQRGTREHRNFSAVVQAFTNRGRSNGI